MTPPFKLLALGGDHIGPEVTDAALRVFRFLTEREQLSVEIESDLLGGASWDVHHTFCTDAVVEKARNADAILVGSVGGPEWDDISVDGPITESDGLTRLRIELDVYNALRPARAWKPLLSQTPFRSEVVDSADILVVRENSGGIYYGEPRGRERQTDGQERAFEISEYRTIEVERIARCAFAATEARGGKLVSLDKSNVMETGKLWRETVSRVGREEFPDIELTHLLMDYALFAIARSPRSFDVVLADNLFGDLVSDLVGIVSGSLGLLPSATLPGPGVSGGNIRGGLFEPTHGSAPDISGKGIANPIGAILSVAMIFEYAMARADIARDIENAIEHVLQTKLRTPDIGGTSSTVSVTDAVIANL